MKTKYSVTFVAQRIAHHAEHSGYHLLAQHVGGDVVEVVPPRTLAHRGAAKLVDFAVGSRKPAWYSRSSALAELKVAIRQVRPGRDVVHYLYGEHNYALAGFVRRVPGAANRVLATFHTPAWRIRELMPDPRLLRRLDGVVVVSTAQLDGLADLVGEDRLTFIPHGVDVDFFSPRRWVTPDVPTFLTVGHHLRDFPLLVQVARHTARTLDARFIVVARADAVSSLRGAPNISVLSGISDEQLRELYRSSTALLMPVTDATANNGLLEAMACGLPVLSTDLPGIRDYTRPSCCVLTPAGDPAAATDAVVSTARSELDLAAMSAASRRVALGFAWDRVAEGVERLHRSLWS